MPRYFMHLRDGTDEVLDPEGTEMPEDAVARAALYAARDCMAGDVKAGQLDFHYRIDVENESGELVHSIKFADALAIVPRRTFAGLPDVRCQALTFWRPGEVANAGLHRLTRSLIEVTRPCQL